MILKKQYIVFVYLIFIGSLFQSCSTEKNRKEALLNDLWNVKGKGILFGHQDDLAYGKNWKYIDGRSDVKEVAGDYPAVFGWEIGGLERGDKLNLDAVPFDEMIRLAIKADQMGGLNTFSWHPYSLVNSENSWNTDTAVVKHIIPSGDLHQEFIKQLDKLAEFFSQLKDENENPIPFIFRPWHEMGGSWFWWGQSLTSPEDYKELFRFTIQYLIEEKGLSNMLVCYSPDGGYENADEYLIWYPGDDLVDMLGVDIYDWNNRDEWVETTQRKLKIMIEVAKEKKKLAAFTETGSENIPNPNWFTKKLNKVLEHEEIANELSYVLVWRNDPVVHHFFSYKGHASEKDARAFLQQSNIWLLDDYKSNK